MQLLVLLITCAIFYMFAIIQYLPSFFQPCKNHFTVAVKFRQEHNFWSHDALLL